MYEEKSYRKSGDSSVLTPYQVYQKYVSLKLHFTNPTYDYVKFNGKIKSQLSSFETRRDKFYFDKLSKKKDIETYLISNFHKDPQTWIGDIVDRGEQNYIEWIKKQQSLKYTFEKDLDNLNPDLKENFKLQDQYPYLLNLFLKKKINKESIIIFDKVTDCFEHWKKIVKEDVLFPEIIHNLKKTGVFISIDVVQYKRLIKEYFVNTSYTS